MRSLDEHQMLLEYDIHLTTSTVFLTGEVNEAMYETVVKGLHLLAKKEKIHLVLNSEGGSWYEGIAIYDTIKAHPSYISIEVRGIAASMATIILQAADRRVINYRSSLMIHDGQEGFDGNSRDFETVARLSKIHRDTMYSIYAEGSGKSKRFWKEKCKQDYWMTSEEALTLGLVDEILIKN